MADASAKHAVDPARLLLIVSGQALADGLAGPLAAEFGAPPIAVSVDAGRYGVDLLRNAPFHIVAADVDCLSDLAAGSDERIARLAKAASGSLLLVLSADPSISVTMGAMRAGAHDCIGRDCSPGTMAQRMAERPGHYMPVSLLNSQLATLEPPGADEALTLSIDMPVDRMVDTAIAHFLKGSS